MSDVPQGKSRSGGTSWLTSDRYPAMAQLPYEIAEYTVKLAKIDLVWTERHRPASVSKVPPSTHFLLRRLARLAHLAHDCTGQAAQGRYDYLRRRGWLPGPARREWRSRQHARGPGDRSQVLAMLGLLLARMLELAQLEVVGELQVASRWPSGVERE